MSNVIELYADARPCDVEASDMGIISAHAAYDRSHYMFARSIREGRYPHLELVKTEPLRAWWKEALCAVALFVIVAIAYVVFP